LIELGQRPDYLLIQRHVINIDALFLEYAQHYFAKAEPKAWDVIVQIEGKLNEKNIPRNMIGREKRVVALEQYLSQVRNYDPVLDGLRSAVRYDKTYFDKIVASLLPLLEKLTSGKIAQLLAPNYSDLNDPRPIFDWMQMIRKRAVVYIGLDALSDAEVAAAVGNSMFSDLVSVAGHIYKHGIDDGLPGASSNTKIPINLHADEFNELMGDEFIPMVNKGGGAGVQVTAYTQTLSDIEARIGNRAKAGQVIGNFNNLFMLRVRETATAELLTKQLPKVEVYTTTIVSGATDSSDIRGATDFTSNTQDRISLSSVPMIEPAHVVALPKGQCFALMQGGQLWKATKLCPKVCSNWPSICGKTMSKPATGGKTRVLACCRTRACRRICWITQTSPANLKPRHEPSRHRRPKTTKHPTRLVCPHRQLAISTVRCTGWFAAAVHHR